MPLLWGAKPQGTAGDQYDGRGELGSKHRVGLAREAKAADPCVQQYGALLSNPWKYVEEMTFRVMLYFGDVVSEIVVGL